MVAGVVRMRCADAGQALEVAVLPWCGHEAHRGEGSPCMQVRYVGGSCTWQGSAWVCSSACSTSVVGGWGWVRRQSTPAAACAATVMRDLA